MSMKGRRKGREKRRGKGGRREKGRRKKEEEDLVKAYRREQETAKMAELHCSQAEKVRHSLVAQ